MRNRTLVVVLAALIAMALSSTVFAAAMSAKPAANAAKPQFDQSAALERLWNSPDSAVVGTVNGTKVTKADLLKMMWFWNGPSSLQDLLNEKMIQGAAAKAGVKVTDADVQANIKKSCSRMGVTSVKQLLDQFHITYYRFMEVTKLQTVMEKLAQQSVKITDASYGDWIRVRHILVKFPQEQTDKAKQDEAAKKKIEEIAARVKKGEDFAKLADECSDDPGNSKDGTKLGGDLGWFTHGRMMQEFENAAFKLKEGEVSEPVKTFYGYHLIKMEKLGKDATAAEKADLKKQIMESEVPNKMSDLFSKLQASATVDNKLMGPQAKPEKPVMGPGPGRSPKPITVKPVTPPPAPVSPKPAQAPPPPPPPAD